MYVHVCTWCIWCPEESEGGTCPLYPKFHRWFWATRWVLGVKPTSSPRTASLQSWTRGFILAHSSREQFILVGKACWQELGHSHEAEREKHWHHRMVKCTFRVRLPPQWNISGTIFIGTNSCFHGDFKPFYIYKEYQPSQLVFSNHLLGMGDPPLLEPPNPRLLF